MPEKTTATVENLAEYLGIIRDQGFGDYISRGESSKHPRITASAFRPYEDSVVNNKSFGKRQIEEFYSYVGNELTPMQKEHFTAFAQHHGLPTNLIDFSTSPLVSLFFACYDDAIYHKKDGANGYVYFIKKHRLVRIDDMITKDADFNFVRALLQDDALKERLIYNALFLRKAEYHRTLTTLADLISPEENIKDFLDPLMSLNVNTTDSAEVAHTALKWLLTLMERRHLPKRFLSYSYSHIRTERITVYYTLMCFLEFYWRMLYSIYGNDNKLKEFYLPVYFTYAPPNIMGRINMQNSIFIAQVYMQGERGPRFLSTQMIEPDFTVEVKNKLGILRELDAVGINLKTIYSDYDNIAKHIKNKLYY